MKILEKFIAVLIWSLIFLGVYFLLFVISFFFFQNGGGPYDDNSFEHLVKRSVILNFVAVCIVGVIIRIAKIEKPLTLTIFLGAIIGGIFSTLVSPLIILMGYQ